MEILVATDLSPGAERAARRAALLLAQSPAARMHLLHVIEPGLLQRLGGVAGSIRSAATQRAEQLVREGLDRLVHRVTARSHVEVSLGLVEGDARRCILEQAELRQPDLLVVGLSGNSRLRRLVFGSTAEYLTERSNQPVLVARRAARGPYRRVLIPLAASDDPVDALALARRLAPEAAIVLFHAYDVDIETQLRYASVAEDVIRDARRRAHAEALTQLREKRALAGPAYADVTLEAVRSHVAVGILDAERQHDCDLVVMRRNGAGQFERMLLGGKTKRVLMHSRADVLVLPP